MATATIATGLTRLTACEAAHDSYWLGTGGAASSQNTDLVKEGSASRARRIDNTTYGFSFNYYAANGNTTIDLSSTHVWLWFLCLQPGLVASITSGGIRIRISSNTTANTSTYAEWYVGGNENYKGGWKRFVVNTAKTPTATNGSPNLAAATNVGIVATMGDVGGNVANVAIDCIDAGNGIVVYGGTSSDKLTFQNIADADTASTSTPNYGILEKTGDVFNMLGTIQLGESTGTNDTYFDDEDSILIWQERPYYDNTSQVTATADTFNKLSVVGSGTAGQDIDFQCGNKVGTGDTAVGSNGVLFQAEKGSNLTKLTVDLDDANVDYVKLYGCTIRRASQGVTFCNDSTNGPNHELIGTTIDHSGQVDVGRVEVRNCTFSGTTASDYSGSALLWNANIDVKNCSFLANLLTGGPGEDETFTSANVNTTTNIITITGHPFSNNDVVEFSITTTIPAPLVAGTNYYVVGVSGNDFQVSSTLGGSAVDLTSGGSGTHTVKTVDAHAIKHSTTGTFTHDNLTHTGNDYDIENSAAGTNTATYGADAGTERDGSTNIYSGSIVGAGQSFAGDGGTLSNVTFYLQKTGSPTGNITAKVYAHSGVYGTSSVPTGGALATSETISATTINREWSYANFFFTGESGSPDNNIVLTNGTDYVVTIEYSGGDVSNYISVGTDTSTPGHGGNFSTYNGSVWSAVSGTDALFRLRTGGIVVVNTTNGSNPGLAHNTGSPPGSTTIINSVNLTVRGVSAGTRVAFIANETTARHTLGDIIASGEANSSGIFTYSYNFTVSQGINIISRLVGYLPFKSTDTIDSGGVDVTAVWQIDPISDKIDTSG